MISSSNSNHQKHAKLARPTSGEWGRNELAILGTDCNSIKQLVYAIIQQLPAYKIGYADADHKGADTNRQGISAITAGAYADYINKISFTQLNINSQPSTFQKKALLHDCDLIMVNGNHFTAAKQIIVIDDKKPLEKKLDKLTDVQLILLKDTADGIPGYILKQVSNFPAIPIFSFSNTEVIISHVEKIIQQQIPAVNGLVLSGGKSTRMGSDKGAIQYYDKSQREHVYELLAPFCNETYISCNREQAVSISMAMPLMEDTFLGLGPAGGILSAFQQNPNVAWLTIACDLPFINAEVIQYLISHRNPSKMATAFLDAEGEFPEPLVTIWEPRAYSVLLQFLSQGYSCPRKALLHSDVEILKAPDTFAFKNINTTEEYNAAMAILHKKHNS